MGGGRHSLIKHLNCKFSLVLGLYLTVKQCGNAHYVNMSPKICNIVFTKIGQGGGSKCQTSFKTFLKMKPFWYPPASLTNTIDAQGMTHTRVKMATGKTDKLIKGGKTPISTGRVW